MEHKDDDIEYQKSRPDQLVYLNMGTLKLVFVVDDRQQNRDLLSSLFEHMGKWFEENAEHLADAPEMDGSSWRLHEEIIEKPTLELPEITEIPDFLPPEWEG